MPSPALLLSLGRRTFCPAASRPESKPAAPKCEQRGQPRYEGCVSGLSDPSEHSAGFRDAYPELADELIVRRALGVDEVVVVALEEVSVALAADDAVQDERVQE